jgi:DNA-binding MarR family transcriptional regulator
MESGGRDSAGLMLALLGHEAMRRLRLAHQAHDLSPRQFRLLELLRERGDLGQSALAAEVEEAASVLVTQLNPLEEAGLLTRRRDPTDRRRHLVALTVTGRARAEAAVRAQREVEDLLFRSLTTDQRGQLTELLALVRDDLTGGHSQCATTASLERN